MGQVPPSAVGLPQRVSRSPGAQGHRGTRNSSPRAPAPRHLSYQPPHPSRLGSAPLLFLRISSACQVVVLLAPGKERARHPEALLSEPTAPDAWAVQAAACMLITLIDDPVFVLDVATLPRSVWSSLTARWPIAAWVSRADGQDPNPIGSRGADGERRQASTQAAARGYGHLLWGTEFRVLMQLMGHA